MMNNPGFYKFPIFTVVVYFTYFEGMEALSEHIVCLKRLKTSAFGSSEPLLLANGRVSGRVYDSMIDVTCTVHTVCRIYVRASNFACALPLANNSTSINSHTY